MSTSAYRLRRPEIRIVPASARSRRSVNPLAFLRRRRSRRRGMLVNGWRDEAILRSLTKLG